MPKVSKEVLDAARETTEKTALKPNYLLLDFGYSSKLIVPYKKGLEIVAALDHAEVFNRTYSEPDVISPLEEDTLKTTVISHSNYVLIKMANLLNITVDELKDAQRELNEPIKTDS